MNKPSIRQAGAIVLVLSLVTKGVGLIREAVIAAVYGTTHTVDVYLAAVTLPMIIGGILYQALPNAFVPLFSAGPYLSAQTRRQAWKVLAAAAGLTIGLWTFADFAVLLTSSGFESPLRTQASMLLRIASGAVLLSTVEALGRGRLVSQSRFVQSGLSPLWSSLIVIAAVTLFPDGGAHTLAWAFLVGATAMAAWNLLPFASGAGSSLEARPESGLAESRTLPANNDGQWISIILLIGVLNLLYGIVDRYLGSYLQEGAIAAIQYAGLVATQPVGIVGVAMGTAIFPFLSARFAERDYDGAAVIINRAVRWTLFAAVPAAVVTTMFGTEIITLLFGRGEFGVRSQSLTGGLLAIYGLGILPTILVAVIAKVFYSQRNWKPILLGVVAALVTKTALSFLGIGKFDVYVLPVATTVAAWVLAIILLSSLPAWGKRPFWSGWMRSVVALTIISLAACVLGGQVRGLMDGFSVKIQAICSLGVSATVGAGLLAGLGRRLGFMEVDEIRTMFHRFIGRGRGRSTG